MSTAPPSNISKKIFFGPFEVTTQVFLQTLHSFALVNLKPLLPGHVLICPLVPHRRLTDLSPPELTDLFTTVQRVQRMLAKKYFFASSSSSTFPPPPIESGGSFNVAIQDGPESGQTVPHVHVHIIPRVKDPKANADAEAPDAIYQLMAAEAGNVGGALWDREVGGLAERIGAQRPVPRGGFPPIEDAMRNARPMAEMEAEAEEYRGLLAQLEKV